MAVMNFKNSLEPKEIQEQFELVFSELANADWAELIDITPRHQGEIKAGHTESTKLSLHKDGAFLLVNLRRVYLELLMDEFNTAYVIRVFVGIAIDRRTGDYEIKYRKCCDDRAICGPCIPDD